MITDTIPGAVHDGKTSGRPAPAGRQKIIDALKSLLREKEFAAITWTDIASRAGVNEGLIHKYFGNLRNLLFRVLEDIVQDYWQRIRLDLGGVEGALNKLRKIIWNLIFIYTSEPVFARILLLEVRNLPGYFQSQTYQVHRYWARLTKAIIEEGMAAGEIRDDIGASDLMNAIYGAIEHSCLPALLFGRDIHPDRLTASICKILFEAIHPIGGGASTAQRSGAAVANPSPSPTEG